MDYFCTISICPKLERDSFNHHQDLSKAKSFNDFKFVPTVVDQFPQQNYPDNPLPEHVAQFVYPDGCCPSARERPPLFYTFVLTSETGSKIYGASMQVWEDVEVRIE